MLLDSDTYDTNETALKTQSIESVIHIISEADNIDKPLEIDNLIQFNINYNMKQ